MADTSQPSYIYKPLSSPEHTRLVKFQPVWRGDDRIRFTLEEVPIAKCPPYVAISYTWGGQIPSVPVTCDDLHMLITENAFLALKRLRPRLGGPRKPSHYWIDAICINQDDIVEKSNQVQRMVGIYKNAQCVAVWLGTIPGPFGKMRWGISEWEIAHDSLLNYKGGELPDHRGLWDLTSREYWTRIWTIQEMHVNDNCKIYVGDYASIPADRLRLLPLEHKGKVHSHIRSKEKHKTPWVTLMLDALLFHQAENAHDYIYGLQAVFNEEFYDIKVDYAKDIDTLYADVAYRILMRGGLDLLIFARHNGKRETCPSWVPDWSSKEKLAWRADLGEHDPVLNPFSRPNASRSSRVSHTLRIGGSIVDDIAVSSPSVMPGYEDCADCAEDQCSDHLWDRIGQWLRVCLENTARMDSDVDHTKTLAQILTTTRSYATVGESSALPPEKYRQLRCSLPDLCAGRDRNHLNTKLEFADLEIARWLRHRHLVLSNTGHMGIAVLSSGVEKGDLIVRFVPLMQTYALRPVLKNGERRYEFLGWVDFLDAYNDFVAPGELENYFKII